MKKMKKIRILKVIGVVMILLVMGIICCVVGGLGAWIGGLIIAGM